MKTIYIGLSITLIIGLVAWWLNVLYQKPEMIDMPVVLQESPQPDTQIGNQQNENHDSLQENDTVSPGFYPPLDRAEERVTKKPFGIFITKQNSPVQPERFSGYHTGADFETFPEEADKDIVIHAVCSGKLLAKRVASGYGGVIVQSCNIDGEVITVVYGHMKLASIKHNSGDMLQAGDELGVLGQGYSAETDGERKHLHLGLRKGSTINILGYVQNKSELSQWLDPCQFICKKSN